jgi:hypothetical protein
MSNNLKIIIGVLITLAASRFVPHPPNFTSLIALSFYIPVLFGRKYIAVVIFSFFLTDLVIGFHSVTIFTWGSVLAIGIISRYFKDPFLKRICGPLLGAIIFFIITNFGVWTQGGYGYSLQGIISCYYMAIPFFHYTILSTLIFSIIIEIIMNFSNSKFFKMKNKNFDY